MSSGPVEQLRPITSTLSASSVASAALMSVPSSILPPLGSSETRGLDRHAAAGELERLAHAEDRGLDLEDVLRGLDDQQVDAALEQALRPARRRPRRARGSGSGRASGPRTRAGSRSGRSSRRRSGPRRPPCGRSRAALAVDLERVLAEAPLVELQPRGLERVGLHDLRAGLDHRLVHALDDVGAVEHERLVAAAGQLVVAARGRGRTARAWRPCRRRRRRRGRGWRQGSRAWSTQASATLTQLWQGCRTSAARSRRGARRGEARRRRGGGDAPRARAAPRLSCAAGEPGRVGERARGRSAACGRSSDRAELGRARGRAASAPQAAAVGSRGERRRARARRRRAPRRPGPGASAAPSTRGNWPASPVWAAWASPAARPAAASSAAVPASAIAAWLSAQRVRETAVASSGSARPLVSSARSRSTAWIA